MTVPRRIASIALAVAAAFLGGCSAVTPLIDHNGPRARMPECQVDGLVFAGETTLASIGLADEGGIDANHVGMIWFTTSPVSQVINGPAGPQAMPVGYVVCAQWDDEESSMMMTVDESWQPPMTADAEPAAGVPLNALAIATAMVVVVGVSWRAFRRDAVDVRVA